MLAYIVFMRFCSWQPESRSVQAALQPDSLFSFFFYENQVTAFIFSTHWLQQNQLLGYNSYLKNTAAVMQLHKPKLSLLVKPYIRLNQWFPISGSKLS